MARTERNVVEDVFTPAATKELWSSIYLPALPFTPQDFSVGAVLPAMLYLFRWGHRRGVGRFKATYSTPMSDGKNMMPSVDDVASTLVGNEAHFEGFSNETGRAILGDLALTYCLENRRHALGRTEQVQRVLPTHYLSSWFDLPDKASNLRFIPEFVVSILANQSEGEFVQPSKRQARFGVASNFDDNVLLRLFGKNMVVSGSLNSNLNSDTFVEDGSQEVGLDQLLLVRIAQGLDGAPVKQKATKDANSDKIRNNRGIAPRALESFREDFSIFVQAYGESIPRQSFTQMLESCLSLNLTNIYLSSVVALLEWEATGKLPEEDSTGILFVDCSSGGDNILRALSEESISECQRRIERTPVVTMILRLLENRVRNNRRLGDKMPRSSSDPAPLINFLGSIYKEEYPDSDKVIDDLFAKCGELASALEAEDDLAPALQELLRTRDKIPVTRLAEALVNLMGNENQSVQYMKALDSTLMTNQSDSNGLGQRRRAQRTVGGKRTMLNVRSAVLTNTMLDFLVHRHLRKAAKGKGRTTLTYVQLLGLLRERYGLYVDVEPPGMSVPTEMLQRNRALLERRLRDLGLLVGVNDAESMKELRPRFEGVGDHA